MFMPGVLHLRFCPVSTISGKLDFFPSEWNSFVQRCPIFSHLWMNRNVLNSGIAGSDGRLWRNCHTDFNVAMPAYTPASRKQGVGFPWILTSICGPCFLGSSHSDLGEMQSWAVEWREGAFHLFGFSCFILFLRQGLYVVLTLLALTQ